MTADDSLLASMRTELDKLPSEVRAEVEVVANLFRKIVAGSNVSYLAIGLVCAELAARESQSFSSSEN